MQKLDHDKQLAEQGLVAQRVMAQRELDQQQHAHELETLRLAKEQESTNLQQQVHQLQQQLKQDRERQAALEPFAPAQPALGTIGRSFAERSD